MLQKVSGRLPSTKLPILQPFFFSRGLTFYIIKICFLEENVYVVRATHRGIHVGLLQGTISLLLSNQRLKKDVKAHCIARKVTMTTSGLNLR